MMTVTTSSGFSCEVNEKAFRDFRTIRAYAKMSGKGPDTEKLEGAVALVNCILRDNEDALYEHVEENGFVDPAKVFAELKEIMDALQEADAAVKKP